MSVFKNEMAMLDVVDRPGSDVEHYALELDKVLLAKIHNIIKMRDNLHTFYKHLKTEEQMSQLFTKMQEQDAP